MRRATTPTIKIDIDKDLTEYFYRVAFKQKGLKTIVKDQDDCTLSEDGKLIEVPLTQEETLSFYANNKVMVQVRYGKNGIVCATNIVTIDIRDILDEEIV